jgi:hypothetical protein
MNLPRATTAVTEKLTSVTITPASISHTAANPTANFCFASA